MALMTTRHIVDFAFSETRGGAASGDDLDEGAGAKLSGALNSVGWTVWARRMIILPIGERWALISILTATTNPRVVFIVLLAGCSFAVLYTLAGRLLRTFKRTTLYDRAVADNLFALTDSGPLATVLFRLPVKAPAPFVALAGALVLTAGLLFGGAGAAWSGALLVAYLLGAGLAVRRTLDHKLDWLVPPVFRAAEYAVVAILAAKIVPDAVGAAYGLIAAVAYHHYDTVYRLRGGHPAPPRWLTWAIGGHEGRVLLVVLLAAFGEDVFRPALIVLAAVIAVIVLAESTAFWVRGATPDIEDEPRTVAPQVNVQATVSVSGESS
jgi:hypothetical protein